MYVTNAVKYITKEKLIKFSELQITGDLQTNISFPFKSSIHKFQKVNNVTLLFASIGTTRCFDSYSVILCNQYYHNCDHKTKAYITRLVFYVQKNTVWVLCALRSFLSVL